MSERNSTETHGHCPYWHGRHYFAPAWYSDTAVVKRCKCGKVVKEPRTFGVAAR